MIAVYVAVGVFVAVIDGSPVVQSAANPEPFRALVVCEEHVKVIRSKAAAKAQDPDSPLVAFGVSCVRIEVQEPKEL